MSTNKPTARQALAINRHIRKHPEWFFERMLGIKMQGRQLEIVQSVRDNRVTTVRSCHAAGKGLALDTPVATPIGWTTMGELKVGDKIFSPSGKVITVSEAHPVRNIDCYRVTFDDHTSIVCDKDHLWTTLDMRARGRIKENLRLGGSTVGDWRNHWNKTATLPVTEIQQTIMHNGQNSHIVPLTRGLDLPDKHYELDPYVLGLWLGDGTSIRPEITDPAGEHIGELKRLGYTLRKFKAGYLYSFWRRGDGRPLLQRLGVYANKHIPTDYLRGSYAQRLAVLQGLMDSDGHVDKIGRLELTQTNHRLAQDCMKLIASLGFKVSCSESDARLNGRFISRRWRIYFTADVCPFRLKRKAQAWRPATVQASRTTGRIIRKVEKIDSVPTRCITVDAEDGLFLAGEQLIPTHNSFTAASTALWFLIAYPESIVVTTAPTWRQVKDILWREIATRFAKAKIPLADKEPTATGFNLSTNWYAVGLSTKDPDKFQGYHADSGHLLAITDEAAGMEEGIFEAIDAILTSEDCRLLMIGNPTSGSGTFRDSHKPAYPANKIKISAFDTPNFTINNIRNEEDLEIAIREKRPLTIAANYLISPVWVYERIKKWGVNSPMYQGRVSAEFPDMSENTLIPLSWIEAACTDERLDKIIGFIPEYPTQATSVADAMQMEKRNALARADRLKLYLDNHDECTGVDVARFGSDTTVQQPRSGRIAGRATITHKEDTMQTAGRVWANMKNLPTERVCVDVIGVGGGVVDRLNELQEEQRALGNAMWTQIIGVNVALPPSATPKNNSMMEFANRRAELYWHLHDLFESGDIYLMPDIDGNPPEDLMSELSSIQYKYLGNKIYIEEKSEMKKRLNGKSPDRADALMLTYDSYDTQSWSTDNGMSIVNRQREQEPDMPFIIGAGGQRADPYVDSIVPITHSLDQRY